MLYGGDWKISIEYVHRNVYYYIDIYDLVMDVMLVATANKVTDVLKTANGLTILNRLLDILFIKSYVR